MPKRKTKEEFLNEAKKLYGNKYDFSKVIYVNSKEKVKIICPQHGEFLKSPNKFLLGQGCNYCAGQVKLTQESFLKRAKEKHGNIYDYTSLEIISKDIKVEIICKNHGAFFQLPLNHISGQGCPKCGRIKAREKQTYTYDEFLKSVKGKHKNKYDYSKVDYKNSQTKIEIICPEHGSFLMKANSHFNGQGCPICGRIRAKKKITLDYDLFKERANSIHGNNYDYIKTTYTKYTSKMEMVCRDHGSFFQTPHSHISMFAGCPKCGYEKAAKSNSLSWDTVHEMFISTHGKRYRYEKESFSNVSSKINIICKKHGSFEQAPYQHYGGSGCPQCSVEEVHEVLKMSFKDFLAKARKEHGKKYDYSDSDYSTIHEPIKIICDKHGEFLQVPRDHYRGSGCPKCNSSKGEREIRRILKNWKITFEEQKVFEDLKLKNHLRCDFYLPNENTVIEFNGLQHYEPISLFGGLEGLRQNQERDRVKYKYLKDNGIKLIIIRFDQLDIGLYLNLNGINSFEKKDLHNGH